MCNDKHHSVIMGPKNKTKEPKKKKTKEPKNLRCWTETELNMYAANCLSGDVK